jgi:hypothetical protein
VPSLLRGADTVDPGQVRAGGRCLYGTVAIAIAYEFGCAGIAGSAVLLADSVGVTLPGRSLVTYAVSPFG